MKSKLKKFSLLTISTLIMAVGIYFFKFANNFTFGGITGIAVLVAKFLPISASDFSFVVNILLLIIGWIVLGKSFAEKTAYSTILLSVSLSLLERIYPMSHPLTNEPLLELIFAILLPALGSAILFNIGASSGGTDVIAMILKKYTNVDIGKGLMISDLIFTLAGFLGVMLSSYEIPAGEDKNTFSYDSMRSVDYNELKQSEKFTPALYHEKNGVWEGGSVSQFTPVMIFRLWEKFSDTSLEVSESMEVNGKRTFGYDEPIIYKRV